MKYHFWFIVGPRCPRSRPSSSEVASLPSLLSRMAAKGDGHWWLDDHAFERRYFVELKSNGVRNPGVATSEDGGEELNLRSFNAHSMSQVIYAFVIEGAAFLEKPFAVTGRYSSFHLECTPISANGDEELASESFLFRRLSSSQVIAAKRNDAVTRLSQRFIYTNDDVTPAEPAEEAKLLPGAVRIECSASDLPDCLDVYLMDRNPAGLTADSEADPRDFLLTPPYCWCENSEVPFFDPQWAKIRELLLLEPVSTSSDILDWPPLLRLCVAALQPGVRDTFLEEGAYSIHPLDVSAQTLWKQANSENCAGRYRDWVLFDAPCTRGDPGGWKEQVVLSERSNYFAQLGQLADWRRVWRTQSTQGQFNLNLGIDTSEADVLNFGGYCGELNSLPPRAEADLRQWISWLTSMPRPNQPPGFETFVALLEVLQNRSSNNRVDSKNLLPLTKLLSRCFTAGSQATTAFFWNDLAVWRFAQCILLPALWQLENLCFAERSPWPVPSVYFLFEYLIHVSSTSDGKTAEWLRRPSRLWQHLSLALATVHPIEGQGKAFVTLPTNPTDAALARLLIPPGRIRSAGFRLGHSLLGHPAHTL
jgi:hypothetical protein